MPHPHGPWQSSRPFKKHSAVLGLRFETGDQPTTLPWMLRTRKNFKNLRAMEIKHGRIAMLATVGSVAGQHGSMAVGFNK